MKFYVHSVMSIIKLYASFVRDIIIDNDNNRNLVETRPNRHNRVICPSIFSNVQTFFPFKNVITRLPMPAASFFFSAVTKRNDEALNNTDSM